MSERIIGGTAIGKIMGVSPYGGPIDVYREIVEGVKLPDSAFLKRGRLMEGVIAQEYEDETGIELDRTDLSPMAHPNVPYFTASPDALAGPTKGVEFKTADWSQIDKWGEPGSDDIPEQYLLQCAWYMMVCDRSVWDVAVIKGNRPLEIYTVHRNLTLENALVEAGHKFYREHIEPRIPPPVDGSPGYTTFLKEKYKENTDTLIYPTPEMEIWANDYIEAKRNLKKAEEAETLAKNHLLQFMQDNDRMHGSDWKISNRVTTRSSVDWKGVANEAGIAPDLIAKYTKTSSFKMFKLTSKKLKGVESE